MTSIPQSIGRRALTISAACLAAGLLVACAAPASLDVDPAPATALKRAIDGPQRSAANRARDADRHPAETLAFFDVRPDQTVIEISPGGGWYTEILAPLLRDHGKLYEATSPRTSASEGERRGRAAFEAKLAAQPQVYGAVIVGDMPANGAFTDIAPPAGADRVLTFRNVHNWMESRNLDDMLRAFYAVLKPGGVLGIEEHRAAPGTPYDRMVETGYVDEDWLVARARAAGFVLAGRADINRNPRDDHEHPNGVWSLPPTYAGKDVDRATFAAIGESDRMTLKFVKPVP